MPKAKHEAVVETAEVDLSEGTPVIVKVEHQLCGHINRHHTDTSGKLTPLACTLEPGHTGDHSAAYTRNVPEYITDHKGIAIKVIQNPTEAVTYWRDEAGTPASEIVPEEVPQMTGYQRDLVMQILQRNPKMSTTEAIEKAKSMKEWR
jgi:hypothetical protein